MRKTITFLLLLFLMPSVATEHKPAVGVSDTLTNERMQRGHVNSAIEGLQGKTAGVTVGNYASSEAMLGSVRVRGNNSLTGGNEPLVIIDGMSSDLRTLASIYPGDIASCTILKDATQTAQYGARGAAGVIEVRTKRGEAGRFSVAYSGDVGVANASKTLPMLSADEYRRICRERGLAIVDMGASTDWQQAILRNGFVQNHHISMGGGNELAQYRASLSYSNNKTVIRNIGNRGFTAKVDVTQKTLNERLIIDLGLFGAMQNSSSIDDEQKLFYSAAAFNPTFPNRRNQDGSWPGYTDASQINPPLALLDIQKDREDIHFNTNVRLTGDIGHGLKISAYGSYSFVNGNIANFFPNYVTSTGEAYREAIQQHNWLTNARLDYGNNWNGHALNVAVIGELQSKTQSGFNTTVNGFTSNAYGYNNLAAGSLRIWSGTASQYERQTLASIIGTASYNALDRYTLSFTARTDASSLASTNHKWGFFPSFSVGWNIHNEAFMEDVSWISNFTLKAGHGLSGNLGGISAYNSLELLVPSAIVNLAGMPTVVMETSVNANPDLTWEKKQTTNVGTEIGIFNGRAVLSLEYYYSYIFDMLYNYEVSVPPFLHDHMLANLGKMENEGVEVGLGAAIVQTNDFDLNLNVNVAWQRNKLLSLDGWLGDQYLTAPKITPIAGLNGAGLHGGQTYAVYQMVGQPLGVFYLPHCTGLETNVLGEKLYMIEDLNNDGLLDMSDGADRHICGQATPKVLLGSNLSLRYKDFDFSIQLNGAFGHKIYNGSALSFTNIGSLPYYNVYKDVEKLTINDMTVSDYWLENGDYVNIDYITIGWTKDDFGETSRFKDRKYLIKRLRLSFSVNNVATITGYSGLSPMINNSVLDSTLGIDDKRTYPVTQTYSFALTLQL